MPLCGCICFITCRILHNLRHALQHSKRGFGAMLTAGRIEVQFNGQFGGRKVLRARTIIGSVRDEDLERICGQVHRHSVTNKG